MVTSGLSTRHFGLAGRNRGGFNCYGTIDGQVSVCKLFWCPPQQQTFSHAEIYRNVLEGCLPIWHEPQHQFYLRCSGVHSGKEHRSHPVYGRPKGSKLSSE